MQLKPSTKCTPHLFARIDSNFTLFFCEKRFAYFGHSSAKRTTYVRPVEYSMSRSADRAYIEVNVRLPSNHCSVCWWLDWFREREPCHNRNCARRVNGRFGTVFFSIFWRTANGAHRQNGVFVWFARVYKTTICRESVLIYTECSVFVHIFIVYCRKLDYDNNNNSDDCIF